MLDALFRDFGLQEREVQIYLELLQLGPQPASTLARRFSMPRSTAQFVVEKLTGVGFVQKLDQKGTTMYAAKDADALRHMLETRKNNMLEDYRRWGVQLAEAAPTINALSRSKSNRPKVSYYAGVAGVIQMFEDVIDTADQVCLVAAIDYICPEILQYLEGSYAPRRRQQVSAQAPTRALIIKGTPSGDYMSRNYEAGHFEQRTISPQVFQTEINIQIYANKVSFYDTYSAQSAHGVLIQSDRVARTMRNIFHTLWKSPLAK